MLRTRHRVRNQTMATTIGAFPSKWVWRPVTSICSCHLAAGPAAPLGATNKKSPGRIGEFLPGPVALRPFGSVWTQQYDSRQSGNCEARAFPHFEGARTCPVRRTPLELSARSYEQNEWSLGWDTGSGTRVARSGPTMQKDREGERSFWVLISS